jgi:hypothetical protein
MIKNYADDGKYYLTLKKEKDLGRDHPREDDSPTGF